MPHFFIDTSDEDQLVRDDDGYEFEDLEAAKRAAISALPDMARDRLPDRDAHAFFAIVRNSEGDDLLRASLSLQVELLIRNANHRKVLV